jgi:outer membrane protein assembly factor BamE (lipoprotein component of BamABCDE complex)
MRAKLYVVFLLTIIFSTLIGCNNYKSEKNNNSIISSTNNTNANNYLKSSERNRFSSGDIDSKFIGLKLGMNKKEVEEILGKPDKTESVFEGAFGEDVLNYYYAFGKIRLEPTRDKSFTVAQIYIDKPNIKGPRDIKVGDTVQKVLDKFPYDDNFQYEQYGDYQIKYLYKISTNNENGISIDSGKIEYNNNLEPKSILYSHENYSLYLQIKNNIVSSISLGAHNN